MNLYFTSARLNTIFKNCLAPFYNAALVDASDQPLRVKYQNLTDIGTYPAATSICRQYLNPQDGDVALINDPYSGGSFLSNMTLVAAVELNVGTRKSDITKVFLCTRIAFKPRIGDGQSVESEGLRIPPTPVYSNGQLNAEVIDIINQHPSKPEHFAEYLEAAIEQLQYASQQLKNELNLANIKLTKKQLAEFHSVSDERAIRVISDLTIGEAYTEINVGSEKEKLCLRVEVLEDRVVFDFTKSTASQLLHLTETAVTGACAGALYSCFDQAVPINAGSLHRVEVKTPQGSFVNAKYPEPIFLGLTDGVAWIASVVVDLIGQIDVRRKMAQSGIHQCSIEIDFGNDGRFFDCLSPGSGASESRQGTPGFSLWSRSHLSPSIEQLESKLPIQVMSSGYRQNSGGNGKHRGGDGLSRTIEVLKPGKLTWATLPFKNKPEGLQGGKAASASEVSIQRRGQQKSKLLQSGTENLLPGDRVIYNSSGGGGFGEMAVEDED